MPAYVQYFSSKPMWKGQKKSRDKYYSDIAFQYADTVFKILTEKGSEGVWEELEKEYNERFLKRGK